MSQFMEELQPYRAEVTRLVIASLISLLLIAVVYYQFDLTESEYTNLLAKQTELDNEYADLLDSREILKDMGMLFQAAKSKGFYGDEQRLEWAERLKERVEQLQLADFKYSIKPQQKINFIGDDFSEEISLYESEMKIKALLLHEGDFQSIKDALHKAPNIFDVNDCKLSRIEGVKENTLTPNVDLNCTFNWYTVKKTEFQGQDENEGFLEEFFND